VDKPPRSPDVGEAGALLFRALADLAERRSDVRTALRTLLDAVESAQPGSHPDRGEASLVDKVLTPRVVPGREEAAARPARKVDLSIVVRRARWKAAACRLAIDKRRADSNDPSIIELEEKLRRQRTSLEDCWAWMLDSPRGLPDDEALSDVAGCYDAVALAAETAVEMGELEPKPPAELLYLLAEAQSSLLSGLHKCDLRGDSDQRDLFLWLKHQTTRHRIYVDRYMRLDDPAGSTGSADLVGRIQDLSERRARQAKRGRARDQLLNKVRYHQQKACGVEAPSDADLRGVEAACAEWIGVGLPVDDADLSELVRELVPDPAQALEATTKILTASSSDGVEEPRRDVLGECGALLEGLQVLVLGVDGQAEETAALVPALGLGGARHVALNTEDDPLVRIEQEVAAPDTDLVLIGYRLPSEVYASFKQLCMDRERPFVRLATGLGAEQVAHQVLRQVAWRFRQGAHEPT
jgi:hypothetical protein